MAPSLELNSHTGISDALGVLVHARDGRWFEVTWKKDLSLNGLQLHSIRDFSALFDTLFPEGVEYGDALATLSPHGVPTYAFSFKHLGDSMLSFAHFDLNGLQKPFAYLNLTHTSSSPQLSAFSQTTPDGFNRTLLALSSSSHIHLIRLPESSDQIDANMPVSWELNWSNASAPSAFFAVSTSHDSLWHVSLEPEMLLRYGKGVSAVWMATVVDRFLPGHGNTSTLTIHMYPEFSNGWHALTPFPVLDPLNWGVNGVPCPWNVEWFHNGQCSARPSQTLFQESGVIIPDIAMRNIKPFFWLQNIVPPGSFGSNWTTPAYTALFFMTDSMLYTYGLQPVETDPLLTKIELMNNFTLLGVGNRLTVTSNGAHVFPVVKKPKWELESINRFAEMCDLTKNLVNETVLIREVLQDMKSACLESYSRVSVADFVEYLGMCPIGSFCPSASAMLTGSVYPGSYAIYPLSMKFCEPGSYCMLGVRHECPPGFICPLESQIIPIPCPADSISNGKTCWASGLTEPIPARKGTIPTYLFSKPVPAPPGYYAVHEPQSGLISRATCATGEYCPLGRDESEDRKCPAGAFCSKTTNLLPIQCSLSIPDSYCSYCPAGSTEDEACPAGSYCPTPNLRVDCVSPYHCPAGSLSPTLCPPGYYCPTPAEKKLCPKNYYCGLGTITPSPCAILSYCPSGTKNNSANFILALVSVVAIAALVAVWRILEIQITKRRLERSRQMQDAERILARTRLQQQHANESILNVNRYELSEEDEDDDPASGLLDRSNSPAALAALINEDLNSRMPPLPFTVDIAFKELGLKIKGTEKKVLDGVTGTIRSGRVTAVMGPSGAGKTTFMSTLANKAHYGDRTGAISLNGQRGDLTSIQKLVGFVPQDDVMLRELSVTEILTFNAKMRLPSDMSEEEVQAVVRKSIRLLGLYDIRHELIGDETKRGISGGQRKRVNIGMELVAQPAVLFLDEPTSGLDSSASLDVCSILRRVAEEAGMNVIAVIHQPRYDIFIKFHDVLLLGKGGRTVYLGPTDEAVAYFEKIGFEMPAHCNPADFLIDVVAGAVPRKGYPEYVKEDLFTLWAEHTKEQKDEFNTMPNSDVEDSDY